MRWESRYTSACKDSAVEYGAAPAFQEGASFPTSLRASCAAFGEPQRPPGFLSRQLLRSLWVPYLGYSVSKLCEVGALGMYLGFRVTLYSRASPAPSVGPSSGALHAGMATTRLLDALYVGESPIHGRGVFTGTPLPCGTRLPLSWCTEAHQPLEQWLLPGPAHLLLFSDTYEQLPETLHYSHPSGKLMSVMMSHGETATAPPVDPTAAVEGPSRGSYSHALLNHSCAPNVCRGLSRAFWAPALAADRYRPSSAHKNGSPSWRTKIHSFVGFEDPNAFFLTRDVAAHEELTIDYGGRTAPLYAARRTSLSAEWSPLAGSITVCRCGAKEVCRHRLYKPANVSLANITPQPEQHRNFIAASKLLAEGYDDECALLSLLPSPTPMLQYLKGTPIASLADATGAPALPPPLHSQSYKKSDFLIAYRHVFTKLNDIRPVRSGLL